MVGVVADFLDSSLDTFIGADRRKGKQMPKPYHLDISVRNKKSKMKYNTLCKIIAGVLGSGLLLRRSIYN